MWDGMYPAETDAALNARVQFPQPDPPKRPSAWAQMGEMIAAPYKGFAQGVNQTLRVANQVLTARPTQNSEQDSESDYSLFPDAHARFREIRAQSRIENAAMAKDGDDAMRHAIDFWNPDPVTSTMASQVLQQGARVITKAAGYGLAGGLPAAAVGTGIDEGATGYLELRDKGVDQATAAKVGAVRGVATGIGVALPIAGSGIAQTAGLIAVGGPGSFMAEQALTQNILESANYPELAKQYDPTDPTGLILSIAIPGTIGAAAHAIRLRNPTATALADSPDHLEAAHVAFRDDQVKAGALFDPADMGAMGTHVEQVRVAAHALEEGNPVSALDAVVDPAREAALHAELETRMAEFRPELEAEFKTRMDAEALQGRLPEPGIPAGLKPEATRAREVFDSFVQSGGNDFDAHLAAVGENPTVRNLAIGLFEGRKDPARQARLLQDYSRAVDRSGLAPVDVAANSVEAHRQGIPKRDETTPYAQAAEDIVSRRPDLPVRVDESLPPVAARDVVDQVKAQAARDRQDSRAFSAAIECALRSGQ